MHVFLSAGSDAVDASPLTKDLAIHKFAQENSLPLEKIAGIGDGVNDLPFLQLNGLGYVGTPKNAQRNVIDVVKNIRNSFVSDKSYCFAFSDFYDACAELGIRYIFSDRDGVLINENNNGYEIISPIFGKMGYEKNPFIIVLTGSSYEQNIGFIKGINKERILGKNENIIKMPFFIYAENGAVQINGLDGSVRQTEGLDKELINCLRKEFNKIFFEGVKKNILSKFNVSISYKSSSQVSRLYVPKKITMVTVNLPTVHHGITNYRMSKEAEFLREALLNEMVIAAELVSITYSIL
jgi:hydroxymethylpyrimidine pyrophosphatase-like HAD family hydrolase